MGIWKVELYCVYAIAVWSSRYYIYILNILNIYDICIFDSPEIVDIRYVFDIYIYSFVYVQYVGNQ